MSSDTRTFPLGTVLTAVTGCVIGEPTELFGDGDGSLYALARWMTGESVMTHQLPRVLDECTAELVRQHPWLAGVAVPEGGFSGKPHVEQWLAAHIVRHGAKVEVSPLSPEDHTSIDPLVEYQMMKPGGNVTPIVVDDAP